jgi:hypothetical protein
MPEKLCAEFFGQNRLQPHFKGDRVNGAFLPQPPASVEVSGNSEHKTFYRNENTASCRGLHKSAD